MTDLSTSITATTPSLISSLSLHDALPILRQPPLALPAVPVRGGRRPPREPQPAARGAGDEPGRRGPRVLRDRKSTRLNSSHLVISYAVFCLKKKNICSRVFRTCELLSSRA